MADDKDNKFSIESIFAFFKDLLMKQLANIPNSLMSSFDGLFGGMFGTILKHFGGEKISEQIAEFRDKASEMITNVTATVDKDLAAANKGTADTVSKFFTNHAASLLVNEKNATILKDHVSKTVSQFFASGIPALDTNNLPASAYAASITLRAELITALTGNDATVGFLSPTLPNRAAEAERIATLITGIPAGADLVAVSGTEPKHGIAAMLADIQKTRHAENFQTGDVKEANITLALDGNLLKPATLGNNNIAGGNNTKEPSSPAGGKPKQPATHAK